MMFVFVIVLLSPEMASISGPAMDLANLGSHLTNDFYTHNLLLNFETFADNFCINAATLVSWHVQKFVQVSKVKK